MSKRGAPAVFNFSLCFFFSARISSIQNAPPVSGTLAGFCEWRGKLGGGEEV